VLPGQGPEATLMWLTAAEVIRAHRAPPAASPANRDLISAPS